MSIEVVTILMFGGLITCLLLGIPLAFGGNIFNEIPGLSDLIPGYYIGADISQAVAGIEALLSTPDLSIKETSAVNAYGDLLEEIRTNLPVLENQTVIAFTASNPEAFSYTTVRNVTNFLLQEQPFAVSWIPESAITMNNPRLPQ